MSTTSQSIQYRQQLSGKTRVSFVTTDPMIQQHVPRHQPCAYRAQNTIIDSHRVAMEIHEHRI